ncbi:MAG: hypothetical protein ACREA0_09230 [bacterium]
MENERSARLRVLACLPRNLSSQRNLVSIPLVGRVFSALIVATLVLPAADRGNDRIVDR